MENSRICDPLAPIIITRANVGRLLDTGNLQAAMNNGRWWDMRRNGATKTWKRDPSRIAIPYKVGLSKYGSITESDFGADGRLSPHHYRINPDRMDYAQEVVRGLARAALEGAGIIGGEPIACEDEDGNPCKVSIARDGTLRRA